MRGDVTRPSRGSEVGRTARGAGNSFSVGYRKLQLDFECQVQQGKFVGEVFRASSCRLHDALPHHRFEIFNGLPEALFFFQPSTTLSTHISSLTGSRCSSSMNLIASSSSLSSLVFFTASIDFYPSLRFKHLHAWSLRTLRVLFCVRIPCAVPG